MKLTESQKIALEMASIAMESLPETGMEYHNRVWKAFDLGKQFYIEERKERKMQVIILNTNDYWVGLYVGGKLVFQGHELKEYGGDHTFLLRKAEEYGFTSKDVICTYVTDEDDEYVCDCGCFPQDINELKGDYINEDED